MPLPFLLPILSTVAPALGRLVLGNTDRAEAVTSSVVSVVQEVVGTKVETPEQAQEVAQKIAADPELRAKLQTRLAVIEQQEFELLLADKQDARSRSVRLAELGRESWRPTAMLVSAFVAIIAIVVALIWLSQPRAEAETLNSEIVGTVIGFLTGIGGMFARNIGSAFDFEFGSSRGSKEKSAQIDSLTEQVRRTSESSANVREQVGEAVAGAVVGATLKSFRDKMSKD